MRRERVVIIGSGPAGLSAALYTARAMFSTVVITGPQFGGQIATTFDVDNFPGFPEGITGPELIERMKNQAERFGAEFVFDAVTEVDFTHGSPFTIKTPDETFVADAVIITAGADPRKLGVPGEREYVGKGVSYCATCDGFFFRGKEIIVVGGGDSALQEGIFLTKFGKKVTIVHRRDSFRASTALQVRAKANEKMDFLMDTVVEEIKGSDNGVVKSVTLRNVKTDEVTEKLVDGVFVFVGYNPNGGIFGGQVATDADGYVLVDQLMRTNVDGIFAGGEIQDRIWRQAATAAGEGVSAALSATNWLQERLDQLEPITKKIPVEEVPVE
jgi:thioredoxin reductase (NADPH)